MIAAVGKRGRYEKKIHGMDNVDHDDRHYDADNGFRRGGKRRNNRKPCSYENHQEKSRRDIHP